MARTTRTDKGDQHALVTTQDQETEADARRYVAAVKRAEQGDRTALVEVRQAFDQAPALWRGIGDLAANAERALLQAATGDNLVFREACTRTMRAMRADLAGADPTPLERLLVDRIVACWLALHYAETVYHQHLGTVTAVEAEFHQRRIDGAQRRYLAAIRSLAQVRRLLLPAVQLNIAERQVNVLQTGAPEPVLSSDEDSE